MKSFTLLAYFILTAILPAQSDHAKKLWIELSTQVQNTHEGLNRLDGASPDPSSYEKRLNAINQTLEALVKIGELKSHRVGIKIPVADKMKEHYEKKVLTLKPAIDEISKTYGIYTAREMCDMGARLHFQTIYPNSTYQMHIRLPEKEMKNYLSHLKKIGLIEKIPPVAEAEQPAKPAQSAQQVPYKDGHHWFIVERFAKRIQLIIDAYDTADKYSHLPYKFGSANPSNGGFDCSGATSYVMKKAGLKPPRTSAQQFIWLRDKGQIQLIGKKIESLKNPAFDSLLPGDLVFWSGTYTPTDGRTVNISHVGIYLGTEKDGRHIMACATNGRSYRGKKGNGYGIYDFKLPSKTSKATFVGYGSPF